MSNPPSDFRRLRQASEIAGGLSYPGLTLCPPVPRSFRSRGPHVAPEIDARLSAAAYEGLIPDRPAPPIVRAARVFDLCRLWERLRRLDPADSSDAALRHHRQSIWGIEQEARIQRAAVIELLERRELSPIPFSGDRELTALLEQLDTELSKVIEKDKR